MRADHQMRAELLFIVARERPDLYEFLLREFSDAPEVDVVLDRRLGERRGRHDPCGVERRREERRRDPNDDSLSGLGWMLVRR